MRVGRKVNVFYCTVQMVKRYTLWKSCQFIILQSANCLNVYEMEESPMNYLALQCETVLNLYEWKSRQCIILQSTTILNVYTMEESSMYHLAEYKCFKCIRDGRVTDVLSCRLQMF